MFKQNQSDSMGIQIKVRGHSQIREWKRCKCKVLTPEIQPNKICVYHLWHKGPVCSLYSQVTLLVQLSVFKPVPTSSDFFYKSDSGGAFCTLWNTINSNNITSVASFKVRRFVHVLIYFSSAFLSCSDDAQFLVFFQFNSAVSSVQKSDIPDVMASFTASRIVSNCFFSSQYVIQRFSLGIQENFSLGSSS